MALTLTVLRCPLWVPPQPSPGKRIVHLVSFALASLPAMLRQVFWQPEVVLAVEPTLFCLPAAWLTGRLCGARTWLHVQDFEADAAFEVGQLKPVELRFVVAWLEEKGMAGFDRVSTISAKMLSRLTLKGVPEEACRLFPNWVDTDAIFPLPQPSPLRRELGIPDGEMVALYAGTMAGKQGLEILAEVAGKLAGRAGLRFVFCGAGPGKARLAELTSQMANVQWIPLQPLDRLNHLLNLADIHLLPQKADAADLVMPSKLTGMLASGRPASRYARRQRCTCSATTASRSRSVTCWSRGLRACCSSASIVASSRSASASASSASAARSRGSSRAATSSRRRRRCFSIAAKSTRIRLRSRPVAMRRGSG